MELLHRQTSLIRFARAYCLEHSAGNTESAAVKWRETRIAKERGPMKTFHKMLIAGSLLAAAAGLLVLPQFAASPVQHMPGTHQGTASPNEPTPAFHAEAPKDALPPTMEASLFTDIQTFNAYVVAGRSQRVLYQQPCYCHCDRSQGHGSLLDCFASKHGAECGTCIREDFTRTSNPRRGKALRRFARVLSRESGSRWTPLSTRSRCPQGDTHPAAIVLPKHFPEAPCHNMRQFVNSAYRSQK